MRDHGTPLYKQLAAAGNRAPTVTPGSAVQTTTFNLQGLPSTTVDMRNYLRNIVIRVTTVFDPDAAGNAVDWDKLYKVTDAVRVFCPLLGELYPVAHTRGAVLGHLYQVVAGGYTYPQAPRLQLPASTDTNVTLDLYYVVPFSFEFLVKPQEVSPYIGFLEGGELDHRLAASNVLDGDYAGAVLTTTTTIRAWVEYLPSSDRVLQVPFQWREYIVPGGGTEFILRNVGGQSGLRGVESGCGLAMLAWLTDATGIGLSGADGVDEINRIDMPWRSQESIDVVDPYFASLARLTRHGQAINRQAATQGAGWPYTQAATVNNSLANAQAMFLPLVMPGADGETSKYQRVAGDLRVNLGFGTTPSASSRFVTLELLEYTDRQSADLVRAMGIDPAATLPRPKAMRKNNPDPRKTRYVRRTIDDMPPGSGGG